MASAAWKVRRSIFSRQIAEVRYLNRVFAAMAAVGLLASAIVHFAALAGSNLEFRVILPLFLPIPVLIIPIAVANSASDFRSAARVQSEFLAEFYGSIPKWAKNGILGLFLYFLVNFGVFGVMTGNGFPERMRDGSVAIMSHGKFVRRSNQEDMRKAELMREGFFSSGGAVVYLYFFAYYGLRSNERVLKS
jgi:hypothetical protein